MRTIHLLIEGGVWRSASSARSVSRYCHSSSSRLEIHSSWEGRAMKTVNRYNKKGRNHRNVEINSRGISGEDRAGVKIN